MDPNMNTVTEKIFQLIPLLNRTLSIASIKASNDFSRHHHEILFILSEYEYLTMSDIGKFLFISKPNTTNLVDKLIQQGLVKRSAHEKDRRVILVSITEEGRKVFRATLEQLKGNAEENLVYLTAEERIKISESLDTLHQLLRKALKE
ncbi:MarR family winged helix-turn-helix transcriptional regulator [Sinanaerobacter chloroacetimidivorans]|uniref:MarR family transcriptional regulator n=1 Tax=Sinanaerobacter chloroacetimidivorans TaxID=2818044 RepID=A0A8J7VXV6_9FIRM|nr:MarR family transcriptional regulator [Sinanaerobacter chloroacetimidivorans]MBR0597092.1 MarR family transcriptional regulator [Sinanaerobacter chloroacetimidivorans]